MSSNLVSPGRAKRTARGVRGIGAAVAALALVGSIGTVGALCPITGESEAAIPVGPTVKDLFQGTQWLNSRPLVPSDLRGKVVLVNFWTYSCINCLRALPHIREWAAKYHDKGLVVIGVHSPEFGFEHRPANISTAAGSLGVSYPVAVDSDFRIWRAFDNEAWPAVYLFDNHGRLRKRTYGEGDYDSAEHLIQQLLVEQGTLASAARGAAPPVKATGTQAAADEADIGSGETYVGYAKASGFVTADPLLRDRPGRYRVDVSLPLNRWGLSGVWTVGGEYAVSNSASARVVYRFHARDLHLVLGPGQAGHAVRFRVTIDGAAPGNSHGTDTDAQGFGSIRETKLYQLVRQQGAVADRTFQIEFLDPGARAYAFTFG